MNKYIVTLASMGYPRWRDVQDAVDVTEVDPESDATKWTMKGYGCETYEDFYKLLNPYGLTKTTLLYAPKYSTIPQDSLIDYGKNATPGTIAAWIDHWFEFTKPDIEKDRIMEWLPYIALIIVICIGGYILAEAVQMAGK